MTPWATLLLRHRFGAALRSLTAALAVGVSANVADAQVLKGSVRDVDGSQPIVSVEILVRDSIGRELARVYSDESGTFTLRLRERVAFSVHARRIGYQLADTDLLRVREDTVNLDFRLAQVASEVDAVNVTAMAALNAQRLAEAQRRGWTVYDPELVAEHRGRARDLTQLLRSLGPRTLQMPRNPRDCVRSSRTNRCVTYVLDGQVMGTEAMVLADDIYFLAVLTPSESAVMYGSRAVDGAIVVYTRMNGDRYDESRLPPHLRRTERRPNPPPD